MRDDAVAARILAVFLEELGEQLRAMSAELLGLESQPEDAERLQSLFRVLHTLKGAAGAAQVSLVADCCHELEALLSEARSGAIVLGRAEFDQLLSAVDALDDARRRLVAVESLDGSPLAALVHALHVATADRKERRLASAGSWSPPPIVSAPPDTSPRPAAGRTAAPAPPRTPGEGAPREEHVRVPVDKLDALLALSGKLVMAERRVQTRAAEAAALHDVVSVLVASRARSAPRRRRAVAGGGGERLAPPDQELAAGEGRVRDVLREVLELTQGMVADARALGAVSRQVADHASRLFMRPFGDASQPLVRVVRDAASATGKRAQLVVTGTEVEADRRVLDALHDVLPHLVRNAVDHGIEDATERSRAGKPATGTVRVDAVVRGRQLVVTVADDGAGIDVAAIRAQLARRGAPASDDEATVLGAVFESGLSTRAEATAMSGRGVGLDAVRSAVTGVGGSVHVESTAGAGARFVIECPLDLALMRALLFSANQRLLAVPSAAVERLVRVDSSQVQYAQGRTVLGIASVAVPVPLVSLGRLFGVAGATDAGIGSSAVVLAVGGRRLAIAVDELLSEEEIVVRPAPRLGAALPYFSGAALVGGRVALVLHPSALVEAGLGLSAVPEPRPGTGAPTQRILVVDDSITTRTLEQSVLEGAGYEVLTANDGAEGWRLLQERGADLVVADVEMPRMDGFALCEAIRSSPQFRELPIVLVTALETPAHRERGLEAGADAYIGKSSFEQATLLETIRELLEDA